MSGMSVVSRRLRTGVGVFAVVAASTAVAACGSSSSGSSGSGGGGSSKAGASAVTAAQKYVTAAEKRPTSVGLTKPIGKPVPSGKKIAYISCGATACNTVGDVVAQAGKALGWSTQVVQTQGTPQSVQSAWTQVLRQKPDGIVYVAFDRAEFNQQLLQAKADGIPVVACCSDDTSGDGIDYAIFNSPTQARLLGPVFANWAAAQGSAQTVYVNVSAYPVLNAIERSFKTKLPKVKPGTSLNVMNLPVTSLGQNAPNLIVAYLRSHPGVKYVAAGIGQELTGVPAALKAAGISGVKLFSATPTPINLQYIASGEQDAAVNYDYYETSYAMVDALARKFAGVAIQKAFNPPVWIVAKSNIPATNAVFPTVANVAGLFTKLWGK